jgi:regulator of nonsense transcripts 2
MNDSQRVSLYQLNITAPPDPANWSKLDGSIKKNTSFIKKLKAGITASQLESLKADVVTLKLEKYIEEVATSIAEATYKSVADVCAAVQIISLIHQRWQFSAFLPLLFKQIQNPSSEAKEKDESIRVSKQKSALMLMTELYLVGVAKDGSKSKEGLIPSILKILLSKDTKNHLNVQLAVSFTKHYGLIFLPNAVNLNYPFVTPLMQGSIHVLLSSYFESLASRLERENKVPLF